MVPGHEETLGFQINGEMLFFPSPLFFFFGPREMPAYAGCEYPF